jgi:hypothetical protein
VSLPIVDVSELPIDPELPPIDPELPPIDPELPPIVLPPGAGPVVAVVGRLPDVSHADVSPEPPYVPPALGGRFCVGFDEGVPYEVGDPACGVDCCVVMVLLVVLGVSAGLLFS